MREKRQCVGWEGREEEIVLGESDVELSIVYELGKALKLPASWEELDDVIWIGWEGDDIGAQIGSQNDESRGGGLAAAGEDSLCKGTSELSVCQ